MAPASSLLSISSWMSACSRSSRCDEKPTDSGVAVCAITVAVKKTISEATMTRLRSRCDIRLLDGEWICLGPIVRKKFGGSVCESNPRYNVNSITYTAADGTEKQYFRHNSA